MSLGRHVSPLEQPAQLTGPGEPASTRSGERTGASHAIVSLRPTAETWSVANDDAGIAALVAQLRAAAPTLVVLEATGHFHGAVTAALAAAGLPVVVVNPRQVRACAHAVGMVAKTDRLDARVIAHCAEAVRPLPRPLPDAATQERRAVLLRRRQLVEMLTAEHNRRASAPLGKPRKLP